MKKIILSAIGAVVLGLIFTSCRKDNVERVDYGEGSQVVVKFTGETFGRRAFFDPLAVAEPWEKSLHTVSVFVFTASDGKLVLRRDMTAAELASGSVRFSLPWSAADKLLRFYAVANYAISDQNVTESGLESLLDVECGAYNGAISEVFTKAKRADGFTMSAVKDVQLSGTANSVTTVEMTLKRTVAKVAMRVTVDDEFADRYKGSAIRLTNVNVLKTERTTPVFALATPTSGLMNMTLSQAPYVVDQTYESLFYLFENGARTADNFVTLEIEGLFDVDSDFATTGDQSVVSYNVQLNAKNGGSIARNGYYRVDASLRGLDGHEVDVSIKVSDWEVPVMQSETLGN